MKSFRPIKRKLLLFLYGLDIGDTPGDATKVKKINQISFVGGVAIHRNRKRRRTGA